MKEDVLKKCPYCGVHPGQTHEEGCEVERCSVCGEQRIGCNCRGHSPKFARWTGIWPGEAESLFLRMDLNEFYNNRCYKLFFVKPSSGR